VPDLLADLERYAAAAQEAVPATDLVRARSRAGRRRPARLVALVAAGSLAAGIVAVVALDDDGRPRDEVRSEPPTSPPTDPTTASTGPVTTVAGTSTLRTFPVVAVTDREYLVWGGEAGSEDAVRADGFAVEVASGAIRPIPPAPIDPRSGATGVWTGRELIVCCGTGTADGYPRETRSAASWDPATGRWEALATPPASIARSYPAAVWTGEVMVVLATGPAVVTYDPATDRWAEAPTPPSIERIPEAVWTGSEVVLWNPAYGGDRGWRWVPGQSSWTPLPDLPEGARTVLGSMAWTGAEVVVWGQSTDDEAMATGARWRPGDGGWRPVRPSPRGPVDDPYNGTSGSQALTATADGRVVVRDIDDDQLYLYDPRTDRWSDAGLALAGWNPDVTVVDRRVLVPDQARPIIGTLP
jgi:hypothetical protein